MSAEPLVPAPSVDTAAQELASRQRVGPGRPEPIASLDALRGLPDWLESAHPTLRRASADREKAAEWILDNGHILTAAVRQVRLDLPPSYLRELPALAAPEEAGSARIYRLAGALHGCAPHGLSPSILHRFLSAYQAVEPLRLGELWALPIMLRIVALERFLRAAAHLFPELPPPLPAGLDPPAAPEVHTDAIATAIRDLRTLSSISWAEFVTEHSALEAELRREPTGVYARMDFETCDRYRQVIETLAREVGRPEPEIAREAVRLTRSFLDHDARRAHVGYWLIDEGRRSLERAVGARPPWRERARRAIRARSGLCYFALLLGFTLAPLTLPAGLLYTAGASPALWALGLALGLLPASAVGVAVTQWAITRLLPPRVLPKLDLEVAIPPEFGTAVVVPTLLGSVAEARHLLAIIERHYLSNPDPALGFVLLTDFLDAPTPAVADDEPALDAARTGIRELNRRYGGGAGGPFHLLHRERLWNPGEGCWMGWERKRGKLWEFNRWLRGHPDTSFAVHEGDPATLRTARFVITLDTDTLLPRGAAARLVGTLAHPLNRADPDPITGGVRAGYAILQPRVDISPDSAQRSRFAAIAAGDTSIDIYSRAVSDAYQDLFGVGIYVGKGIYDVDAFMRSLAGRTPENRLASHDLFEGLHARTALASDVTLYEDYPASYLASSRRHHRWIRGDWQLLPWLGRRVATEAGRAPSRFGALARWMIADNLRRSVLPVALLALLAAGWLWLPGDPLGWTALALLAPAVPSLLGLAGLAAAMPRRRPERTLLGAQRLFREQARGWLLLLAFLPHEAYVAVDAIARTLFRMFVTRRRLLEWTTAAHASAELARGHVRPRTWQEMLAAPLVALGLGLAILLQRPAALPVAAPFLLAWLVAPEFAYRLSLPVRRRRESLPARDQAWLRALARRTWLFFETFVGPDDHWLPPDNYQEQPGGVIAHRTSPTNIGMLLVATIGAWDLGYLGRNSLRARMTSALGSLDRLERYRGHLLNWYDTRTLAALEPRFVSMVDSGNLAGALLVVAEGCRDAASAALIREERWQGLSDVLALLRAALANGQQADPAAGRDDVVSALDAMERDVGSARASPWVAPQAVLELSERGCSELDRRIVASLAAEREPVGLVELREIRTWLARLHEQVRDLRRDLDTFTPWWEALCGEPPDKVNPEEWQRAIEQAHRLLPATLAFDAVPARAAELSRRIGALRGHPAWNGAAAQRWLDDLDERLDAGARRSAALVADLLATARRAEAEALGMDFRLVYDAERRLFRIGHNLSADRPDSHHYDLLASEARIGSLVAIAKGDVPASHWFQLGRPLTRVARRTLLLSWGGTMFEYLMPPLLARSHPGTLLAESERGAVVAQIQDGRRRGIPWGVSESGFATLDAGHNYQYRAFGVPALGLRSGLERDCVIAPYATALALPVRPRAAVENLRRLESLGMIGSYGLYEALDYASEGVESAREPRIVRSYMAHHQGMVLAALVNQLAGDPMIARFHRHPRLAAADLLLHERVPGEAPLERPTGGEASLPHAPPAALPLPSWSPVAGPRHPQAHLLGNGRLRSIVSESGAGALLFRDCAVTRWVPDPTLEPTGLWLYLCDVDDGRIWSATRLPCSEAADDRRVTFHAHSVEFHQRAHGISTHLEVAVGASEDVELRRIALINDSDRPRRLLLSSYAEIALATPAEFERHPAFSRLFVDAEFQEALDGLLLTRRAREPGATAYAMLQRLVSEDPRVRLVGYEASRARFIGRLGSARAPASVGATPSQSADPAFDPIASLQVEVELEPYGRAELALVTAVGASQNAVHEAVLRYETLAAVDWGLGEAAAESRHAATRLGLDRELLPTYQRLFASLAFPMRPGVRPPDPPLRGGQGRLWGFGISGDAPIALLRIDRPELAERLHELLRAHALWRSRGERIDLVVLLGFQSGYLDEFAEALRAALRELDAEGWLGRPGGVHLVRADQVRVEDLQLLEACARVIVDAGGGSLDAQLERAVSASVPPFEPPLPAAPPTRVPPLEPPAGLLLDNGYGGFTADGREYVIHLREGERTPAPWTNLLANPDFGSLVSEAGLGCTWRENSAEHRLTPWCNDPVCDPQGEAIYLRDEDTGEVWSPTPAPAGGRAAFEIRHGAGYTQWRRSDHGLEQRLRVRVAAHDPVKIARLSLRNPGSQVRRLTATYLAEWVLGARPGISPLIETQYSPDLGALLATNGWEAEPGERVAFLAGASVPHGFTTDRTEFLGREGTRSAPAALRRWGPAGRTGSEDDPCAALQFYLEVPPGGNAELYWLLGEADDRRHLEGLLERWREPGHLDRDERRLAELWDARLGAVEVHTPDPAVDLLVNRWLLYQTWSARLLGRTGFYQPSGAFGFRDQLQDVLAIAWAEPEFTRAHLLRCAERQFEEGDVLHWWHPPGNRGVRTRCSDDLLWLPHAVARYVEQTGDLRVLEERVPFLSAPPLSAEERDRYASFGSSATGSSLFEHCVRALERASATGAHGLPLMRDGDWNDGMNRVGSAGRGESVWLAWFAADTLQRFAGVCEARGEPELGRFYRERARGLVGAAEQSAWDGAWYLRAFADDGVPLGSAGSANCKIDSIAQSWAELCGQADPARVGGALVSAFELLVSGDPPLVRLLTPPFETTHHDPGYIKAYPPGVRENGGQYAHAAAWLGLAFARRGDGDRAYAILRALSPVERAADRERADRYRLEPFAMAGDVCSEPPHAGRGGWSGYTGAAGWTWRMIVEGMLGIDLRADRLLVRPALPAGWSGYRARLRTPAGILELEVDAAGDGASLPRVRVDGAPLPDAGLPLAAVTPGRPRRGPA